MDINKIGQFHLTSRGFPHDIKYYTSKVIDKCIIEFSKFSRRSKWYNYTTENTINFNISEVNSNFPISKIDLLFQVSVKQTNYNHEASEGSFTPYTRKEDVDENGNIKVSMSIKIFIDANKKSVSMDKVRSEIDMTIRHEMQHAYEAYLLQIVKNKPAKTWINDWQFVSKDFMLGLDKLSYFIYLMYLCQAEERTAHLAQIRFGSDINDLLSTVNDLINFNYLKTYGGVWSESKSSGVDEDEFSMVVRRLMSNYNDFCDDNDLEPLPKMVRLERSSLLKFMKYWQPIFHKCGKQMKRKLIRKGNI